jgi:hypothetical protein
MLCAASEVLTVDTQKTEEFKPKKAKVDAKINRRYAVFGLRLGQLCRLFTPDAY